MSYRLRAAAARWLLRLGRLRAWRWTLGTIRIVVGAGSRRTLRMSPAAQLEPDPDVVGGWRALGPDPSFVSQDLYALIPKGWCHIDARLSAPEGTRAFVYLDTGRGFGAETPIEVAVDPFEGLSARIRIPASTRAIRIDPLEEPGEFRLGPVEIVQASAAVQLVQAFRGVRRRSRAWLGSLARAARRASGVVIVRPARWVGRALGGIVAIGMRRSTLRQAPLEPEKQLAQVPGHRGRWHALGSDPRFRLAVERVPRGWCVLVTDLDAHANGEDPGPALYATNRRGDEIPLPASAWVSEHGRVRAVVYLPLRARGLSWRPVGRPGEFHQEPTLTLEPVSPIGRIRARARTRTGA